MVTPRCGYSLMRRAYLFILAGDDEELDGLARTVHYLVQYEAANIKGHISIYYLFPVFQYEIAGRDNDQVTYQHDSSQSDVAVFVDDSGDDVGSAGTSVGCRRRLPMPPPQKDAPMTHAMNGWSCKQGRRPAVSCWITDRKKVRVNTPNMVLRLNS